MLPVRSKLVLLGVIAAIGENPSLELVKLA